jgi:predicted Zn-dependent protease
MAAGSTPPEELLERLDTGILVRHFHYVNGFLDPRRAKMTGMTRYGTFWVESGRIRHALKNLRWTQDMLSALGDGLVALGSEQEVSFGRGGGTCTTPAAIVEGFHVTGATG